MMDSDGSEEFNDVFETGDEKRVDKLVDKVLSLNKNQQLKKPSRTEPALKISEFDLVKSVADKASIQLSELAQTLKHKKNRIKINEKIKKVQKSQTLPKPLEKPQADRIRRTVAYEKSRLELDRWESVVTSNRVATNLSFPLKQDVIDKKDVENFPSMWRIKSDLQKELEKVEPKIETYTIDLEKEKFPLSLKEMLARRREAAKLRAFQGYREAKARRQNKIKSKKYHRIQRREKIKEKLKEFEMLQKTNPEEALKRLEEIERARIQERFSLRHKSTGKWAKSKQVRAKYDKESRQVLAQQLAISRELTQKMQTQDDSGSDNEVVEDENSEVKINGTDYKDNPWVNGIKPQKEVADFVSGYRKFWNEQNKAKTIEGEESVVAIINENGDPQNEQSKIIVKPVHSGHLEETENLNKTTQNKDELHNENIVKSKTKRLKKTKENVVNKKRKSNEIENKKDKAKLEATSDWDVSTIDIEHMFDNLEDNIQKKMLKNVKQMQKRIHKEAKKEESKPLQKSNQNSSKKKIDLSLPIQKKRPVIDEELIEDINHNNIEDNTTQTISELEKILSANTKPNESKTKPVDKGTVDPNNFIKMKTTHLDTAIPNLLSTDDNEDDEEADIKQRNLITEAFEDVDLVQDFHKEKKDEINKNKPKNINLALPGWGCWGGSNIKISRRKNRRFTVKAPPTFPRKDDNKGSVIINEDAQKKIKEHMVSEIPFPFNSVKDFEASIRAPIGNTFVPETAFRRLTRPAVVTKMGAIIEPMDKTALLNKKKK